jgi:hypothetical protein
MKNMAGWGNRALTLPGCGVLALCLSGCVAVGVRELQWNGLGTGEVLSVFNLYPKSITSFPQFYYTPKPGTPVITIRMPDGKFIPADNLNRDTLAPYFAAGTASQGDYAILISYSRGRVDVYLDEHGNPKLVIVDYDSCHTHREIQGKPPAIATPDGETILEFPLREKELEDVFGKPTEDERSIRVGPPLV